jgi:hypothetical protein
MIVKMKRLLNDDELNYLNTLYIQHSPPTFHPQDFNLFNVYKTNLSNKLIADSKLWESIKQKLLDFHGRDCTLTTNYFLDYREEAYAKMHQDNPDTVAGTAVTLIEKSQDILGGDIVIGVHKEGKSNLRKLPQEVGTTIYYNAATNHSVTKVIKGNRKVLITWFRK